MTLAKPAPNAPSACIYEDASKVLFYYASKQPKWEMESVNGFITK